MVRAASCTLRYLPPRLEEPPGIPIECPLSAGFSALSSDPHLGVGTEELFDDHSCIMVIASMIEFVDDGICAHPLTHRVLQLRDHQFCLRWSCLVVG